MGRVLFQAELLRECGGGKEARTPDPRLAKPMLSQLSYTPMRRSGGPDPDRTDYLCIASAVLSQMSYRPEMNENGAPSRDRTENRDLTKVVLLPSELPGPTMWQRSWGSNPEVSGSKGPRVASYTTPQWSSQSELNRRPPVYKTGALPTELHERNGAGDWDRTSDLKFGKLRLYP